MERKKIGVVRKLSSGLIGSMLCAVLVASAVLVITSAGAVALTISPAYATNPCLSSSNVIEKDITVGAVGTATANPAGYNWYYSTGDSDPTTQSATASASSGTSYAQAEATGNRSLTAPVYSLPSCNEIAYTGGTVHIATATFNVSYSYSGSLDVNCIGEETSEQAIGQANLNLYFDLWDSTSSSWVVPIASTASIAVYNNQISCTSPGGSQSFIFSGSNGATYDIVTTPQFTLNTNNDYTFVEITDPVSYAFAAANPASGSVYAGAYFENYGTSNQVTVSSVSCGYC